MGHLECNEWEHRSTSCERLVSSFDDESVEDDLLQFFTSAIGNDKLQGGTPTGTYE